MDLLEGIFSRRSIRRYRDREISEEHLQLILKAGMQAPSAVNKQPWHFIVVQDHRILHRITQVHPHARMLDEAALGILVLGDTHLEHGPGYWAVDCGAATQNILLAAHGLGYGAVWLGIHPREERRMAFRELFDLPGYIQPFAMVSVGHPGETKAIEDRFKTERIHFNKWSNQGV
jgi:nitroreductase